MTGNAAPKQTVQATVVDARFVQERGPDGHTRIGLRTVDGRNLTATRPGRQRWRTGDVVTAEIAGTRVLRIRAAAADPEG